MQDIWGNDPSQLDGTCLIAAVDYDAPDLFGCKFTPHCMRTIQAGFFDQRVRVDAGHRPNRLRIQCYALRLAGRRGQGVLGQCV